MNTPLTGPLAGPLPVRPPLTGEPSPLAGSAAAPPAAGPPEAAAARPALPGDEGVVERIVLEAPRGQLDLEQLELDPASAGKAPELPQAVASLLAQAAQRGVTLPFDAASVAAEAAADTTPLPGLAPVAGLLRPEASPSVAPPLPAALAAAARGARQVQVPRKRAPAGGNFLAKRTTLVDHLQRNAVQLVRAALTLGDLRTALSKATSDGATPGTLRLLAAAIARMESLCGRLEHAIEADGQALIRLDAAAEGEG